jgi:hypothetical protein
MEPRVPSRHDISVYQIIRGQHLDDVPPEKMGRASPWSMSVADRVGCATPLRTVYRVLCFAFFLTAEGSWGRVCGDWLFSH